ncbi:MAG: VOC family protein [Rhodospirillales bacterium]|nr:VOC family protein [Rhodospirillales bacterium]MDP6643871.1 VOC family protein [Rhodospirillales bacterium]MDP6842204.1 VOC family protein [Rhodospirillales bacterium]
MQLPGPGEIYLDHVGWYVPDLDEVARAFGRLGFALTPYALHGDRDPVSGDIIPLGSANRLAMLESGYLEFLTDVEGTDTTVTRHLRDRMEHYVGVHLTAFSVADAETEAARLQAAGIAIQPTVNLRRSVEAADGNEAEAAFTVVRAGFDWFPEGRMQVLTHHTPEHVWQPRFMARDNAIVGLAEAVFSVDDPEASASRLADFTGRPARATEHGMEIGLDRGKLSFVDPDGIGRALGISGAPDAPATAAVGLISRDLAVTRDYFLGRDIRLAEQRADRLVVDAGEALGAALVINPVGRGTGFD